MLEGGKYRGWTLCVCPTSIWVPVMSQCGASEVQRPGRGAAVGSGKICPFHEDFEKQAEKGSIIFIKLFF